MSQGHHELSLTPQIRHNSSKLQYMAFTSEVHVLWLRVTKSIGLEVTSYIEVR